MKKAIEVVFYREGKKWLAQALNVDVATFGDSLDDARAAIKEALELYFEGEKDVEVLEVSDPHLEQVLVEH
jgi:predicted RNase H-like HicB family nuclease